MIRYIFYTNCPVPNIKYPNIFFKSISYDDYCRYIADKLSISFAPERAYKLADLKPFIAYLHEDDFSESEFWSFGDLDLCYGDMSLILNRELLTRYDLITTHDYHVAGHFTVMRNNSHYRNLCFEIKDWKTLLETPQNLAVDEICWSKLISPYLKYPLFLYNKVLKKFIPGCFHQLMDASNRFLNPRELFREYYTSPEPDPNQKWIYDLSSGKIYDNAMRELPYLHFLFFKSHPDKNHEHWMPGYYQLDEPIESYRRIEFSLEGIKGFK